MLLYSLLHLAGVKAVNPQVRAARRARRCRSTTSSGSASSTASAPAIPSTAGPPAWRPPRARSARAGHQRRHGHRRPLAGQPLQPARLRDVRLRRLRPLRRRLPDGRRHQRGGVARRPPEARQPVLDLRQQPHHDRGPHRSGLQRRRGHALHRLRLERDPRGRRQRSGDARPGLRAPSRRPTTGRPSSSSTATSATGRPTSRTRTPPTASRSARRRSASPRSNYGWPEDAKFLVPDGVREHFQAGHRAARRRGSATAWMHLFEDYQRSIRSWPTHL